MKRMNQIWIKKSKSIIPASPTKMPGIIKVSNASTSPSPVPNTKVANVL